MEDQIDRKVFQARLKENEPEIRALCQYIHANPELGFEERLGSQAVSEFLERRGFQVECGCAGMETAFRAVKDSGKPGPTVGFLCEYDALPEMGHACGHNIIAAGSAGAAATAAAYLEELGGRVVVLGTPSEEGAGGGKVALLEQGYMDDLDCAMMIHPGFKTMSRDRFLAISEFSYTFHGKAAHSAGNPEEGVNALEAVLQFFASVNGLRGHLRKEINIHGIITKGGVAPNIIPDLAQAQFALRAPTRESLNEVILKVENCAKGAAMATGCTVEITEIGRGYDDMVANDTLGDLLLESYHAFDIPVQERTPEDGMGSTDAGNVSHHVPTIHGMITLGDWDARMHTPRFEELAGGPAGLTAAVQIAACLGLAGVRLLSEPTILEQAWVEQERRTGRGKRRFPDGERDQKYTEPQ